MQPLRVLVNCQLVFKRMARTKSPLRSRGRGEGMGCFQRVVPFGRLESLTLVLSPWPMGEANKRDNIEPVYTT